MTQKPAEKNRRSGWGLALGITIGVPIALLPIILENRKATSPESQSDAARLDLDGQSSRRATAVRMREDTPAEPVLATVRPPVSSLPSGAIARARAAPAHAPAPAHALSGTPPTVPTYPMPWRRRSLPPDSLTRDSTTQSPPPRNAVEARRPLIIPPVPAPPINEAARREWSSELHHAQFLIKAGLAPLAKDPLEHLLQEAPGTPVAQEAQRTLNSIARVR